MGVVLNKQTVSFDQWVEKFMEQAREKGILQADVFALYEHYQAGMDIDEALIEIENANS